MLINYFSIFLFTIFNQNRFINFISCGSLTFNLILVYKIYFKIPSYCFNCILGTILSLSIYLLSFQLIKNKDNIIFLNILISTITLFMCIIWSNSIDSSNAIDSSNSTEKVSPEITTSCSPQKVKFAKFLSENNIKMYSAYWCPHCHDQKQLFGKKAVKELTIIECAQDGKDNKYKLCREKQIDGFPSWEIKGEIYSGVKDLNDLAIMTNYEGDTNF